MKYLLMLIISLMYCIILTVLHFYVTRISENSKEKKSDTSLKEQKKIAIKKEEEIKKHLKRNMQKKRLKKTEVISQSKVNFKIMIKYNKTNIFSANKNDSKVNLTSGSFQNLSGIFILSGFSDKRNASSLVRLITLQEKQDNRQLLCWFKKDSYLFMSNAIKYKMCENHGRKFEGRIYSCHVPTWSLIPEVVFISVGIITNVTNFLKLDLISLTKKVNQKYFGICIPPIFGSIPMTKLVQYFELSQILGASHFHLYLQNVSSSVHFILNYYAKLNLVSLTQWKLPSIVIGDSIWYHGQLLAIQDCLYRNMANFKYLLFLDLDEFIIPRNNTYSWIDMIASIKTNTKNANQSVGFSFKSAFFDEWQIPDTSQQLSYLQLLERSKTVSNLRTKVMVEADKVFEMGIHHMSKPILDNLKIISVNPDIALIHHYRSCMIQYEPTMKCNPTIRDTMILKYRNQLQYHYKHRIKEIFKELL